MKPLGTALPIVMLGLAVGCAGSFDGEQNGARQASAGWSDGRVESSDAGVPLDRSDGGLSTGDLRLTSRDDGLREDAGTDGCRH